MLIKSDIPRAAAVARIKRQWPQADEIRYEGQCDSCKRKNTLWSYQIPGNGPHGDKDQETCGYWCNRCLWANGGSRPSIDTNEVSK